MKGGFGVSFDLSLSTMPASETSETLDRSSENSLREPSSSFAIHNTLRAALLVIISATTSS
jgi:hypothetical protein